MVLRRDFSFICFHINNVCLWLVCTLSEFRISLCVIEEWSGLGVGKVWYPGGTFLSHVYTLIMFVCGLFVHCQNLEFHCVIWMVGVGWGWVRYGITEGLFFHMFSH